MIKKIAIFFCTAFLFAGLAWTTIAATPSVATQQKILQTNVQYDLPYPGILPDNFFYPLKAFRDRFVSYLITDSQKQAEFDLLQADKRLVAGEYLLQESKPNDALVSQTVSKGENYFGEAIINMQKAKKEGQLVNDTLNKLADASMKHQQVLLSLAGKTTGALHQNLLDDVVRMQGFENQVNKIILQK